jgi:hypothetical protein
MQARQPFKQRFVLNVVLKAMLKNTEIVLPFNYCHLVKKNLHYTHSILIIIFAFASQNIFILDNINIAKTLFRDLTLITERIFFNTFYSFISTVNLYFTTNLALQINCFLRVQREESGYLSRYCY